MEIDYVNLFRAMRKRMEVIKRQALENDHLNTEYINLEIMSNLLMKIIKAQKKQEDMMEQMKTQPGEFNNIILNSETSFWNKLKIIFQ